MWVLSKKVLSKFVFASIYFGKHFLVLSMSPSLYMAIYGYIWLYMAIYVCLSIYLCNLFIYLSTYLPFYLSIYVSIYLSTYLPIYLSIYLSIYPSIYLSIYLSITNPDRNGEMNQVQVVLWETPRPASACSHWRFPQVFSGWDPRNARTNLVESLAQSPMLL